MMTIICRIWGLLLLAGLTQLVHANPPKLNKDDLAAVPERFREVVLAFQDTARLDTKEGLERLDKSVWLMAGALAVVNPTVGPADAERSIRSAIVEFGVTDGFLLPAMNVLDLANSPVIRQSLGADRAMFSSQLTLTSLKEVNPGLSNLLEKSFHLPGPIDIASLQNAPEQFRASLYAALKQRGVQSDTPAKPFAERVGVHALMFGRGSSLGDRQDPVAAGGVKKSPGGQRASGWNQEYIAKGFNQGPFGGRFCLECSDKATAGIGAERQSTPGASAVRRPADEAAGVVDRTVDFAVDFAEKWAVKKAVKYLVVAGAVVVGAAAGGPALAFAAGLAVDVTWAPEPANAPRPRDPIYDAQGTRLETATKTPKKVEENKGTNKNDDKKSDDKTESKQGKNDKKTDGKKSDDKEKVTQAGSDSQRKVQQDDQKQRKKRPLPAACVEKLSSAACIEALWAEERRNVVSRQTAERIANGTEYLTLLIDSSCLQVNCRAPAQLRPGPEKSHANKGRLGAKRSAPVQVGNEAAIAMNDRRQQLAQLGGRLGQTQTLAANVRGLDEYRKESLRRLVTIPEFRNSLGSSAASALERELGRGNPR